MRWFLPGSVSSGFSKGGNVLVSRGFAAGTGVGLFPASQEVFAHFSREGRGPTIQAVLDPSPCHARSEQTS